MIVFTVHPRSEKRVSQDLIVHKKVYETGGFTGGYGAAPAIAALSTFLLIDADEPKDELLGWMGATMAAVIWIGAIILDNQVMAADTTVVKTDTTVVTLEDLEGNPLYANINGECIVLGYLDENNQVWLSAARAAELMGCKGERVLECFTTLVPSTTCTQKGLIDDSRRQPAAVPRNRDGTRRDPAHPR